MQRDSKNAIGEIILGHISHSKGKKITITKYPSKTIKPHPGKNPLMCCWGIIWSPSLPAVTYTPGKGQTSAIGTKIKDP